MEIGVMTCISYQLRILLATEMSLCLFDPNFLFDVRGDYGQETIEHLKASESLTREIQPFPLV